MVDVQSSHIWGCVKSKRPIINQWDSSSAIRTFSMSLRKDGGEGRGLALQGARVALDPGVVSSSTTLSLEST